MTELIVEARKRISHNTQVQVGLLALLLVTLGSVGYAGYRYYRNRVQENAQKVLSEALSEYEKVRATQDPEGLAQAEQMFHEGYVRSTSSTLAPLFLMYEASVQSLRGDLEKAAATLDQASLIMPQNSPYYGLLVLKKAFVKFDQECGDACSLVMPESLKEIEQLAFDSHFMYQELALNYLADFYQVMGREQELEKVRKELSKINNSASSLGLV